MKHTRFTLVAGFFSILIIVVWFYWFTLPGIPNANNFSILETLFSGLAFIGIIFTVIMQKEELELQRKELADTRAEFREQNETIRKQRFENTFFQMLSTHLNNVRDFSFYSSIHQTGRDAIKTYYERFHSDFKAGIINLKTIPTTWSMEDHSEFMMNIYGNYSHSNLAKGFCNSFYALMNLIEHSKLIDNLERNFYAEIVKGQISKDELNSIFYDHYFSKVQKIESRILNKYNVFDAIYPADLFHIDHYNHHLSISSN